MRPIWTILTCLLIWALAIWGANSAFSQWQPFEPKCPNNPTSSECK